MVKNSIKVFGRIKRSNKSSYLRVIYYEYFNLFLISSCILTGNLYLVFLQQYDIRKAKDSKQEVVFTTDSSGEYGIYRNSKHKFRYSIYFYGKIFNSTLLVTYNLLFNLKEKFLLMPLLNINIT